ncbi:MAG: multiheme c-type cytochrome [Desulfatirhabdiaceae bacterium]
MQTGSFKTQLWLKTQLISFFLLAGWFFLVYSDGSLAWGKPVPTDQSGWFVDMNRFADAAHGAIKCEECHGPMTGNGQVHPDTRSADFLKREARRVFEYQNCQKCHKSSYDRFLLGEHAKAMTKEKESGEISKTGYAPTCGDCHSAHYSKSHLSRVETGQNMTETCGACHPDQKASYLANYHGKAAVNLGYDKSASCTDCHGAHTCVSLKDKGDALKTCQRCHPDAPPGFADIIIHDSRSDLDKKSEAKQTGLRLVHTLSLISLIFIVGVLAFFYSHSCLLMLRKLHEKLRKHN